MKILQRNDNKRAKTLTLICGGGSVVWRISRLVRGLLEAARCKDVVVAAQRELVEQR